jgi:hypothetical protein
MAYSLTPLQIFYLRRTVEEDKSPRAIGEERGKTGRNAGHGVALALIDIRNKFAVGTNKEAYTIAVNEGLIDPSTPIEMPKNSKE